jgi:hypothetical protein
MKIGRIETEQNLKETSKRKIAIKGQRISSDVCFLHALWACAVHVGMPFGCVLCLFVCT